MFAGVLTATMRQGQIAEGSDFVAQLYDEVVIPFLRESPGYRGAFTFVNRGLGTVTGVVLYATEADAHQLDQGGTAWVELFARIGPERERQLAALLTEPIHRRVHAIVAQDLALLAGETA
jgi:ABC-type sulfate transport system substrate-binding protein